MYTHNVDADDTKNPLRDLLKMGTNIIKKIYKYWRPPYLSHPCAVQYMSADELVLNVLNKTNLFFFS